MKIKKSIKAWLLMIPALFTLYFMIWRPQVMGFVWSLYKMSGYTPVSFAGLNNYIDVISSTDFLKMLSNTVQYVGWSLVIGFLPPVILAIVLNEMKYCKGFFKTVLYIPSMLPMISVMLMWYFIYYPDATGLLNIILGKLNIEPKMWLNNPNIAIILIIITMTWRSMGASMLLYFSALQTVNTDLYEAALMDGAGILKRIKHITIPQISGVLILSFVNQIISVFQVMEQPLTMTGGGPDNATSTLGLQLYNYAFISGRTGQALALGGIMFVFLLISTCFYFYLNHKVEQNLG